jgi:hypothetical protein
MSFSLHSLRHRGDQSALTVVLNHVLYCLFKDYNRTIGTMSSSFLNLRHVVHSYAKHNWQLAVASAIQVAGLQTLTHAAAHSSSIC